MFQQGLHQLATIVGRKEHYLQVQGKKIYLKGSKQIDFQGILPQKVLKNHFWNLGSKCKVESNSLDFQFFWKKKGIDWKDFIKWFL